MRIPYDLELEMVTGKNNCRIRTGHPVIENDQVVRLRGSFRDITDLKEKNNRLSARNEELLSMNEELCAMNEEITAMNDTGPPMISF